MRLAPQQTFRGLVAAAAVAALVLAPGCDWLKASGPGVRSSPFLSGLTIDPPGDKFCGSENSFAVVFKYDDPQDDIFEVVVSFTHLQSQSVREQRLLWSTLNVDPDQSEARADFFFSCDDPKGRWTVSVQAEDNSGHLSNRVSRELNLL